jgi:hypothetical protein
MSSLRALPIVLRLALLALALLVTAVGLIAILTRTVPRFNRYILLIPALKPFRYYSPEQAENGQVQNRPAPVAADAARRGRIGNREVRAAEVSALGAPWRFEEDEQHLEASRYQDLPAVNMRSFTGAAAQDLAKLWDTQNLDCSQSGSMCFWPSYRLRFFDKDGAVLTAYLCWSCNRAELAFAQQHKRCAFAAATPEARQLKQKLRSLLPPLSTSREWELLGDSDKESGTVPPPPPVAFESLTTSLPQAAELMQHELQLHQRALAYCYEQRLTLRRGPRASSSSSTTSTPTRLRSTRPGSSTLSPPR